ncbi:MAG: hypothetical protein AAGK98_17410 [Pseudomonadota bacterium]
MTVVHAIVQRGRLSYEALVLAASWREAGMAARRQILFLAPRPGPLWPEPPGPDLAIREALLALGAQTSTFSSMTFGADYPHGNKIEALAALPPDAPFLFLDTDTLILQAFDPEHAATAMPSASLNRSNSWPKVPDGEARDAIWLGLYARFGIDFAGSLNLDHPPGAWERYLYFNAGWIHGPAAGPFGVTFREIAGAIRADPGEVLEGQALTPWLDQIALPLTVHAHGGGRESPLRDALDGPAVCHYRWLPLLYARASDAAVEMLERCAFLPEVKVLLQTYEPARRLIFDGEGRRIRALFAAEGVPEDEAVLRKRLRAEGVWIR